MEKIKNFFSTLSKGKILALSSALLMLITSLVNIICYAGAKSLMDNMSWPASIALAAGAAFTIGLVFLLDGKASPIPAVVGSLFGLGFFALKIYTWASAAALGIDSSWEPQFFIVVALIVSCIVLSCVSFALLVPSDKTLAKTLSLAGAIVFAVVATGYQIADENAGQINKALHMSNSKIVKKETNGEPEDTMYFKSDYKNLEELKAGAAEVAEKAQEEGTVLLKNDNNTLPLKEGNRKISFFSVGAIDPIYSGSGSGNVATNGAPTFKSAFERGGKFQVNESLWNYYSSDENKSYKRTTHSTGKGVSGAFTIGDIPFSKVDNDQGSTFSQYGDAAIVVLSRLGGEGSDLPRGKRALNTLNDFDGSLGDTTEGDILKLSPIEKNLLKGLKEKKEAGVFKSVVVILNFANQIEADFLTDAEYGVDAALWIGTPGLAGLYGVADIVSGDANPSAKLSTTFWRNHKLNPAVTNFNVSVYADSPDGYYENGTPNQDRVYSVYQEGVYLGYKYTESRYFDFVEGKNNAGSFSYSDVVSYPFGHGLSYTSFEYSDFEVKSSGTGKEKKYTVSVDVKNTGSVAGKDVIQVYLNRPYGKYNQENGVEAPASELVGFTKTDLLRAGETKRYSVDVDERQFASYDANNAKTYVITAGDYYLSIGKDAHDATNNVLAKRLNSKSSTNNRMDDDGNSILSSDAIKLKEDTKTFSTSYATGEKITNRFDDADYNNYEHKGNDKVTYISRTDWDKTTKLGWDNGVILHYNSNLQADLDKDGRQGETISPVDNSAYPTYGANNGLQLINLKNYSDGTEIPYDDPLWEDLLDQLTFDEMVETVRSGMRMSAAINSIGKPECTDHNGPTGITERFNYNVKGNGLAVTTNDPLKESRAMCYPSSMILAASFNVDLMYEVGNMIGDEAVWVGYAGLYGPGSNICRTPYSGRNFEYYSEDAFLSGMMCAYETNAMENRGLYVYNKHCALNEQEDNRRGIQTWANEQTIRETYLKAFELPITLEGTKYTWNGEEVTFRGASGVMVAFNRIGLKWSGSIKGLMTDFLRTECGMHGAAVTDMWYGSATPYLNVVSMLKAGTNLIDGSIKATEFDEIKKGHADVAWALRESLHRICYSAVHSIAMNGIGNNTYIVKVIEPWRFALVGAEIAFGVAGLGGIAWIGVTHIKKFKKKAVEA